MKKKSKKTIEREKLKVWRLLCLERDDFKCQICDKKPLKPQVHHIIPYHFENLRFDLNNGITLCFQHHAVNKYSPHQNSLWFTNWLKKNRNKEYKYLIKKMK